MMSLLLLFYRCERKNMKSMEVTATAYNSIASQTHKNHPNITAWGDKLKPGMKCIAVSRDLIALGLTHNTKVKIEGLTGEYLVLDKMNNRWMKKIDIYMGDNRDSAIRWGKRKVTITWEVDKE